MNDFLKRSKPFFTSAFCAWAYFSSFSFLHCADNSSLFLNLRVGDIDSVLAESLLEKDELALTVTSNVDVTEQVNEELQKAAEASVRDSSVLDSEGNTFFSIETPPVLSVVIPEGVYAQLDVTIIDPKNYLQGIEMIDKKGAVPEQASFKRATPSEANAYLMTQADAGAFVTGLKLDFKIPVTAEPDFNDIEIIYSVRNVS